MALSVGYVRLSRDDDKKNYTSIENQKLIIIQHAAESGESIDRFYEDDGISGYVFERPGLQAMLDELETKKESVTVYVKDFSRLGRHNAKVLLLLEEFEKKNIRLVAIDDLYDSFADSSDDIVGIKTWFNERYVKDISRKIKKSLTAKQKEGTLLIRARFGYCIRDGKIVVEEESAATVRLIEELYIGGMGDRQVAETLNRKGIPTPSMTRYLHSGRYKSSVVYRWSDNMVAEILQDDYYTGVYRTHKRERETIHGRDIKIPKQQQYVFPDHHETIRNEARHERIQEIRKKRIRSPKKRNADNGQWEKTKIISSFIGSVYCKDCGHRLTPIERKTTKGVRRYYICSSYNSNGKQACGHGHIISEDVLKEALLDYLTVCRKAMGQMLREYNMKEASAQVSAAEREKKKLETEISLRKSELKTLIEQKIRDVALHPEQSELYLSSYDGLQKKLDDEIGRLEIRLENIKQARPDKDTPQILKSAEGLLEEMIEKEELTMLDVQLLADRIIVDKNGNPEISLRYSLSGAIGYDYSELLQSREYEIMRELLAALAEGNDYTSVKGLHRQMNRTCQISMRHMTSYVKLLEKNGVIAPTGFRHRPYRILKTKAELDALRTDIEMKKHDLHCDAAYRRNAGDDF